MYSKILSIFSEFKTFLTLKDLIEALHSAETVNFFPVSGVRKQKQHKHKRPSHKKKHLHILPMQMFVMSGDRTRGQHYKFL